MNHLTIQRPCLIIGTSYLPPGGQHLMIWLTILSVVFLGLICLGILLVAVLHTIIKSREHGD
jgi:hypothetical protein